MHEGSQKRNRPDRGVGAWRSVQLLRLRFGKRNGVVLLRCADAGRLDGRLLLRGVPVLLQAGLYLQGIRHAAVRLLDHVRREDGRGRGVREIPRHCRGETILSVPRGCCAVCGIVPVSGRSGVRRPSLPKRGCRFGRPTVLRFHAARRRFMETVYLRHTDRSLAHP